MNDNVTRTNPVFLRIEDFSFESCFGFLRAIFSYLCFKEVNNQVILFMVIWRSAKIPVKGRILGLCG